jgi:phosphonate transport system permease protein
MKDLLESIKSSGEVKINELFFGVVPQVMPTITSYWLYRFEINLRASAVLGVVGAGGVGAELNNQLRFRDFPACWNSSCSDNIDGTNC